MPTKATIVPAILAASEAEVAQKLLHAREFATEVQVDVVDGRFANPPTWPYTEEKVTGTTELSPFPHTDTVRTELDLMVIEPEKTLSAWMHTGATRILFHLESTPRLEECLRRMRDDYGYDKDFMTPSLSVGVAIHQDTHLERLEPYIDSVDYVQFMGIRRIGTQGQPFSSDVYNLIKRFKEKHPDILVQVDGGVSMDIARQLLSLGVSRLVVGSAIWRTANPHEAYREFVELTEEYGIYE